MFGDRDVPRDRYTQSRLAGVNGPGHLSTDAPRPGHPLRLRFALHGRATPQTHHVASDQ